MADGDDQIYCVSWIDKQGTIATNFKHLQSANSLVDVTLVCDGQFVKSHKLVLSACSLYFKALLDANPAKHPIIVVKDCPHNFMQHILEYMYTGQVDVPQEILGDFLQTANRLKIKGLCGKPSAQNSSK